MTTMAGEGVAPNAGVVARLQAELEAVEAELENSRAEVARLTAVVSVSPSGISMDWRGHMVTVTNTTVDDAVLVWIDTPADGSTLPDGSPAGVRVNVNDGQVYPLVSDSLVCW